MNYASISNGNAAAFDQAVQRWNIGWAMVPNRNAKLTTLLDHSPGWRRLYRDKVGAIYVREAPVSAS